MSQHAEHADRGARAGVPAAGAWSTRCGAAPAAPARTAAATAWSASWRRWTTMRYSLITERRRHAPPGADGGLPGAPGRNLLNGGRAARRRRRASCVPATDCESRPPEVEDMENPDSAATPRRVAFLGLGIMGWPMAANLARAGFELAVWTRTGEKAERFAAEHGGAAGGHAGRGRRGRRRRHHDGRGRPRGRGGAARRATAPPRPWRPAALCVDMSTIAPSAALGDRRAAARARPRLRGRAGHRLAAAGRGRARSRSWSGPTRRTSSAPRPLLEAMGELVVHVGPPGHGAMTKLIDNTVAAINAAALAEALAMVEPRRRRHRRRSSRWPARARAPRPCSS